MSHIVKWSINQSHSQVYFKSTNLINTSVRGVFKVFDASIETIADDFTTAIVSFWIDSTSLSTGNLIRDNHLRSMDFLDAKHYSRISFNSSKIKAIDRDGNHDLWGELTIIGITNTIKLSARIDKIKDGFGAADSIALTINGLLNRSEWGLVWNTIIEVGGIIISEDVELCCELELTKAPEHSISVNKETDTYKLLG